MYHRFSRSQSRLQWSRKPTAVIESAATKEDHGRPRKTKEDHGRPRKTTDEENPMPAIHADYAYRHATKTRRGETRRTNRPSVWPRVSRHPRPGQAQARQRDEEKRRHTLRQLASAERGLHFLAYAAQREYGTDGDNVAVRLNDLGVRNIERGQLVRAFRNFKEAIDRDPGLDLAHNNIGLLYLEIGDHERADHHLTLAIAKEGNLDAALSNRALLWIELEEYDKAYDDLVAAIELDRTEPMHYNNMGVLFLEGEEPEAALDCFDAAIELDPDNPMHHHNRGMAHQQMGNLTQANEAFNTATELAGEELEASVEEARA